jgi:hypothetical protein
VWQFLPPRFSPFFTSVAIKVKECHGRIPVVERQNGTGCKTWGWRRGWWTGGFRVGYVGVWFGCGENLLGFWVDTWGRVFHIVKCKTNVKPEDEDGVDGRGVYGWAGGTQCMWDMYLDSSTLAFSLSSHRPSFISLFFSSRFLDS